MEFSHQGKNGGHFCHPISPWHMASPRGKCWPSEEKVSELNYKLHPLCARNIITYTYVHVPGTKLTSYMFIHVCTRTIHDISHHYRYYFCRASTWNWPGVMTHHYTLWAQWLYALLWLPTHIQSLFLRQPTHDEVHVDGSKNLKRAKLCRSQDSKWLVFR